MCSLGVTGSRIVPVHHISFPKTILPEAACPNLGSDGPSTVPFVVLLGGEGHTEDTPAWYGGTRPKVEARRRMRLDSPSGIMPVDKGCLTVRV
jgi:hypothetical protein